jgi:hypothetical protein
VGAAPAIFFSAGCQAAALAARKLMPLAHQTAGDERRSDRQRTAAHSVEPSYLSVVVAALVVKILRLVPGSEGGSRP